MKKIALSFMLITVLASALSLQDADAHFRNREDPAELQKAIEQYEQILAADPQDVKTAFKLARAYWFKGTHSPKKERKLYFESGIAAAKKAITIAPDRCEGYFWMGLNQALLAENSSNWTALGLINPVKDNMKKALSIDRQCVWAGPQRVLGKLYAEIPWFKGGSKSKSEKYLKESIDICPEDTQSRLFLAQIYLKQKQFELAREQLLLILQMEGLSDWIPETKENKIEAKKLLTEALKKPPRHEDTKNHE